MRNTKRSYWMGMVLGMLGVVSAGAAPGKSPGFRPIAPKSVRVAAAQPQPATWEPSESAAKKSTALAEAWTRFDARDWKGALDRFLEAFSYDPEDAGTAEGLAMSVYRSGDYSSTYRLGQEFSTVLPDVTSLIVRMIEADVRAHIEQGTYGQARQMLRHFPASDRRYSSIHGHLNAAETLNKVIAADRDESPEPTRF